MEFFISMAYAQEDTAANTLSNISPWFFYIIGAALLAITLFYIQAQKTVSSGHAILLGAAAVIICVPQLANFEWSGDSIKFTTKGEASTLASALDGLTKENTQLRQNLQTTQEALQEVTERVRLLEASNGTGTPANPSGSFGDLKKFDPSFWSDLYGQNKAAIATNDLRAEQLNQLMEQLNSPIKP